MLSHLRHYEDTMPTCCLNQRERSELISTLHGSLGYGLFSSSRYESTSWCIIVKSSRTFVFSFTRHLAGHWTLDSGHVKMRHPARVTSHYCYDTRATLRRLATVWRRIDTSNYLHECMKEYRDVLRAPWEPLCVVTTVEQF